MKSESKTSSKNMLSQNDIIRYNGLVYRVVYTQPNGSVYILHELATGARIPCMLKNRQYTVLLNKRLKNDIKRSVRTLRRYNSRNPREPTVVACCVTDQPSNTNTVDTIAAIPVETSKIHIVESYICEQEPKEVVVEPTPVPEPVPVPEEKKSEPTPTPSSPSYIDSVSSYCSIM